MIVIDKLCYQSNLRYANPQLKCIYTLLTLLLCVGTRAMPVALVVLGVNLCFTVGFGGVSLARYLRYLTIPLAFLLASTLSILLNFSPVPFDLFAISLGNLYLTVSREGLFLMVQLVLTALASVSCLYFLSFTTPMPDIIMVLDQCHCPKMILELMLLMYRYIFILLEVARNIAIAQKSRLSQKNYKTAMTAFVSLVSTLFIRAMKQSNALYDAMESRCYDGTIQVLHEYNPPSVREIATVVVVDGGLLVLYLFLTL